MKVVASAPLMRHLHVVLYRLRTNEHFPLRAVFGVLAGFRIAAQFVML